MKTRPDSVHLRAKAEFSLSFTHLSIVEQSFLTWKTYESIPWMNADTALLLGSFNDLLPIKIRGRIS